MTLFQKSVEKKYLNELDPALIDKKFAEFKAYFGHAGIQENIRNAKEEQFQEGFLRELFVKILGYTLNPQLDFNLTTELKNVSDSRKADGAILRNDHAIAVIELKSTHTTDLKSVETQAFGYKNYHPKCIYVITSNFEKLRFYIQNAVNHLEFDLFNLTREEFALLWLCMAKDNLLNDVPLKIKETSLAREEIITKQLYADYSKFREALYRNLVKNNPEIDKLTLFKKTQKLIDRFLFIFFAEDKQLLPANSIIQIIEKWKDDVDFGDVKPLYTIFRKYFHILNVGRPKSDKRQEIYPYNGGLFLTDEVLENVKIDDDVLKTHSLKLSNYDFNTEVDVNILGHIFEHSLGEIENIQAEIKGEKVDNQKTKRKKDGIFYTPKYITQYIVENTVGKLCEEKRNELEIVDEEYAKGRKNRRKETIRELDEKLKKYQEWLLTLTILDPACGSGAFLNQALEFLIEEHRKIDELWAQLFGGAIVFSDISTDILEKNIYGVDINEESVEIAKLSLWLRTARKGRKLNTLSNNIKCGNSLIDDPEIAGDKAFDWQKEFPEIFAKGGFDVVIGNPPYVRVEFIPELQVRYFKEKFISATSKFDLSSIFFEKSINLLNSNGLYSIITSYQFIYTSSGSGLRRFIAENTECSILMFSSETQIFEGATTYTGIFEAKRKRVENVRIIKADNTLQQINIIKSFYLNTNDFSSAKAVVADSSILTKINNHPKIILGSEIGYAKTGVVTSADEVFFITEKVIKKYNLEKELIYPIIGPVELEKWFIKEPETLCLYPYLEENGKTKLIELNVLKERYIGIYNYLQENKEKLVSRSQGRKDYSTSEKWYQLNRPREKWIYDSKKIIYPGTTNSPKFAYDNNCQLFRNARVYAFLLKNDFIDLYSVILPILNSTLTKYLITLKCPPKANNYFEMSTGFMDTFPFILPKGDVKEQFISISETMTNLYNEYYLLKFNFLNFLNLKLKIEKLSTKLHNWYELDSKEFINEFKKNKIRLSLPEEAEWLQYFNEQKQKAHNTKYNIEVIEKEINQMVYKLYELTKEEINIIEESI